MPNPDYGVRPCCFPKCNQRIPRNKAFPVCDECGFKIAVFYLDDAERRTGVLAERQRRNAAFREEYRARRRLTEVVYYVDLGDHIKIGYTSRLRERLSGLRVEPNQLLAYEPGGRDLEKLRHDEFRASRVGQKENFARTPDLEAHIARVRATHDIPAWAKVPDTRVKIRRAK